MGVASSVGRRTYQEDRYCYFCSSYYSPRYCVSQLRPDLLYLAVFDGHGGTLCADYCQVRWQERYSRPVGAHLLYPGAL